MILAITSNVYFIVSTREGGPRRYNEWWERTHTIQSNILPLTPFMLSCLSTCELSLFMNRRQAKKCNICRFHPRNTRICIYLPVYLVILPCCRRLLLKINYFFNTIRLRSVYILYSLTPRQIKTKHIRNQIYRVYLDRKNDSQSARQNVFFLLLLSIESQKPRCVLTT